MRTNRIGRLAAVLVGLEGLGLVALTVWQVLAIVSGDTASIDSAIALVVLTAVGAAAVLAFAVAVWRDRSWARSGAIVTQLLILAVAAPALVTLVLLILAVREAGRASGDEASA